MIDAGQVAFVAANRSISDDVPTHRLFAELDRQLGGWTNWSWDYRRAVVYVLLRKRDCVIEGACIRYCGPRWFMDGIPMAILPDIHRHTLATMQENLRKIYARRVPEVSAQVLSPPLVALMRTARPGLENTENWWRTKVALLSLLYRDNLIWPADDTNADSVGWAMTDVGMIAHAAGSVDMLDLYRENPMFAQEAFNRGF